MYRELLTTFGFLGRDSVFPPRADSARGRGAEGLPVFDELRTNDNASGPPASRTTSQKSPTPFRGVLGDDPF